MNTMHTVRLCALAGLGTLLATSAFSQDHSYGYVGLSGGPSRAKIDQPRITTGLQAEGLATSGFARDEKGSAYKLFGGYQFNRNFGVEAGYFSLGKFGFNATTVPAGALNGQLESHGFNLDLVATLPLTESLSAIGRVGGQMHRTRDRFSSTGAVSLLDPNPSKRAGGYKLGGGLQYEVHRNVMVRAEVEHFRIDDAVGNRGGVNAVSVGLVFPFGRTEAPVQRAMAQAPAVMQPPPPAPLPPPPPVMVQAPPPPMVVPTPRPAVVPERQRVSFSAESLFGFDRADIKPEGKVALDTFARDLRGTRFDLVTVEGHTDRLGSDAYNQKLSAQRADAVRAYLLSAGGLESAKVSAVGKGETRPVTARDACKGNRATPALIACLQPDRRVDVEVTGTR